MKLTREFCLIAALALGLVTVSGLAMAAITAPVSFYDAVTLPSADGEFLFVKDGRDRNRDREHDRSSRSNDDNGNGTDSGHR